VDLVVKHKGNRSLERSSWGGEDNIKIVVKERR
jgi:hypothetical protein